MDNDLEWRYWRQIRGAFFPTPADVTFIFTPKSETLTNITAIQVDTMEEALSLLPPGVSRVFLEPTGTGSISNIPTGDIALVCGNTNTGNTHLSNASERYRINTPGTTDLYAHDAVSVVLALMEGQ